MHVELNGERAVYRRMMSIGAPIVGTVADHVPVARFLSAVFQQPSPEEFASSVDDPFYNPADRILLKHGDTILAHAHLTWRTINFGKARWPLCRLNWLGVLPEYREQGLDGVLMDEAETQLRQLRPALVELGCRQSPVIQRPGWVAVGRYVFSQASPRALLAHLSEERASHASAAYSSLAAPAKSVTARVWRRFELPSLLQIYRENVTGTHGPLQRTETYWRWLLARRAYDQIYVAVETDSKQTTIGLGDGHRDANHDFGDLQGDVSSDLIGGHGRERIVGYAVTRHSQIVELMTEPDNWKAARSLLEAACRDAIDSDHHAVRLHAPESSPLHEFFITAGGSFHPREALPGETMLIWLPDIDRHMARVGPDLAARARSAGMTLPCELGIETAGEREKLVIRGRKARIESDHTGRHFLRCDRGNWIRLLAGYDDAVTAFQEGRITPSTAKAEQIAAALWPNLSVWRPIWDDLSA